MASRSKALWLSLLLPVMTACSVSTSAPEVEPASTPADSAPATADPAEQSDPLTDEVADEGADSSQPPADAAGLIPLVPVIVIPDVTTFGASQQKVSDALGDVATPLSGVSVAAARCTDDGTVFTRSGMTTFGEDGSVSQVGESGAIEVDANGAGTAVLDDAVITVNGDGSGSAVGIEGTIEVEADLSGSYVGPLGVIELNSDGSGSWVADIGAIEVDGKGGGSWTGQMGVITNNGDGSGSWVGDDIVDNFGDGTGTVNGVATPMEPLPEVPPVGRMSPVEDLLPVGRDCGTVISLSDGVLFDFGLADIRADADPVLDEVADYLTSAETTIEVNGHTDSIGTDEFNQDLSERRAEAVWGALQERGLSGTAAVTGLGEGQPIAANTKPDGSDDPAGRQQNRRVEIVLKD